MIMIMIIKEIYSLSYHYYISISVHKMYGKSNKIDISYANMWGRRERDQESIVLEEKGNSDYLIQTM